MHHRAAFTLIEFGILIAIISAIVFGIAFFILQPRPQSVPSVVVSTSTPSIEPSAVVAKSTQAATSTALSVVFPRNIAYGDTGSDVKLLQTILNSLNFYPTGYTPTTTFNLQTQHALLLFQAAHAINESGFLDLQSQSLMNKIAENLSYAPTAPAIPAPATVANLIPNPPPAPPTNTFAVTGVTVSSITDTSAQITVTTNQPASVEIEYGPTTLYGEATQASPDLTTVYQNLVNLAANTPYDFLVIATPEDGSAINSQNYVFVTEASPMQAIGAGNASTSIPTPSLPPSVPPSPQTVPDTVPPTVTILSPSNDAVASGTIMLAANASDNVGVVNVEFFVDNVLQGSVTSPPYAFSLDTMALADGSHVISTKAFDAAGNVGTAPSVFIYTDNAPATLYTILTASPSSGIAPLSVSLSASIGGTALGTINYIFYCNQNTTSTTITSPADLTVNGTTSTAYTAANVCTYSAPGTYSPKVIVEQGSAPPAEAQSAVIVAAAPVQVAPTSTPLVVSGVSVSGITPNSAHILVTAQSAASIQVNYGTTASYGSSTSVLSAAGTLSHTINLANLQPNTVYHYRVKSVDQSGNAVTSGDEILRTEPTTALTQYTSTTLPPFELTATGASQVLFPNSAFHCQTPQSLPGEPQEPKIDGPDGPVNTFRDSNGLIHLLVPGGFNFQFTGTSFNNLTQDCNSIYLSHWNIDPSQYQYNEWLRAPYSIDGTNVYGIVHNEYHCATAEPGSTSNCVYETLTQASSDDGGNTFTEQTMPQRLVATVPYQEQDIPPSTSGVGDNSNIIENPNDGYYYMETTEHSNGVGPCILRSSDLSNWYAWNGTSFSLAMNDPTAYGQPASSYSCTPIVTYPLLGPSTIRYVPQYNVFLGLGGLANSYYYTVSNDLIHWSAPVFLFAPNTFAYVTSTWQAGEALPSKLFYLSLVDPDSADLNFNTITPGDSLYLDTIQQPAVMDSAGVLVGNVLGRSVIEYPLSLSSGAPQADAVPVISPGAGTYSQAQTVTLSCPNPASTIYYTTNGTVPSASTALSSQYSGLITVSASETVKAICVADNYGISAVSNARYTIVPIGT